MIPALAPVSFCRSSADVFMFSVGGLIRLPVNIDCNPASVAHASE
jgi:hypothetical protein